MSLIELRSPMLATPRLIVFFEIRKAGNQMLIDPLKASLVLFQKSHGFSPAS